MNVTRENIDALNATVRIDIVKTDYEEKVEKNSGNTGGQPA
jgi:trigger factor